MRPYLFQIPLPWGLAFRLPAYGSMIAAGFLLGLWLLQRRGRRMGLDPMALFDMATAALIGGLIGARIFYVVHFWENFADHAMSVFAFWKGGLTFYGGLIGGGLGILALVRKRGLPLTRTLDVVCSVVPLGHAFGRTGCFLNGCCFGIRTDAWTGMRFPRVLDAAGTLIGSPPFLEHLHAGLVTRQDAWSLPVHPTQLYEVAYNLTAFVLLGFLLRHRRRSGDVAWTYAIFYACARFANEFVRGDNARLDAFGGLTVFQVISVLIGTFGIVMLARSLRRPPEPMPEPWVPPEPEGA